MGESPSGSPINAVSCEKFHTSRFSLKIIYLPFLLNIYHLINFHNQHPKAQTPFSTQYFHIGLCGKAAPSRSAAHPISDARAPPIGHAYGCSMGSWKISPTAWRYSWTITCHLLEVAEVTVILFFEPVAFKVEFHNLSIHTHHWCLLL